MDDAKYLFLQDAKEKKITARSSFNKVWHTGCKLPSDYMSKKEIRKMNGEVKIMNLRKPMTYTAFKTLPNDLSAEYQNWLINQFGCSCKDFAEKMGINVHQIYNLNTRRKIPAYWNESKKLKLNKEDWEKFWAGEEVEDDVNASESDEKDHSETNIVSECNEPVCENVSESDEKDRSKTNDISKDSELVSENASESNEKPECKPYDLDIDETHFTIRDLKSWDELFDMLRRIKLPEYSIVGVDIQKR